MGWPKVTENDHGIRPAGRPDACFYCHSKVGEEHGRNCVVVTKLVEVEVVIATEEGRLVGVWTLDEPHYWKPENTEFHKNESSWCAGNIFYSWDDVVWADVGLAQRFYDAHAENDRCLCGGLMQVKFLRVVDDTPMIRPE